MGQAFLPARDGARLSIKRRKLPHWRVPGSIYLVTFRLKTGHLNMPERLLVLDQIRAGHGTFYVLVAGVVMPDHIHIILRPRKGTTLQRIMKGIKGVSARRINQRRNRRGALWLDESWDRIIRDHQELVEKINYVLNNPVKAGLVADRREYPASYWSGRTTVEEE
ncbi:MAG: transposase [Planctomycetota bacterium]